MKSLLVVAMCAVSLVGTAMGQIASNFGSRTSGLGNAGGFATGSGLSNGAAGSYYFERNAGPAFASASGLPYSGNGLYNYGGNAYLGSGNLSPMNAVGPVAPGLGLGVGGLGVGRLAGPLSNDMGLGGAGLYGGGLGWGGGLPVIGRDLSGLGYGVSGLNYGLPGTGYGALSPALAGATGGAGATGTAAPVRKRPPESFTNNALQGRADAAAAAIPLVTANALRIQDRIARSGSRANFRNVKVLMLGRVVVLQGSVDSQSDEQLVQRLVSLEPSVDGVISQLTYPGKAPTPIVSAR